MQIEILDQNGQFRFFRRLLNYDERRIAGRPRHTQFLDYQVVNSDLEAERDHLRIGGHIVRVLTMKEGHRRNAAPCARRPAQDSPATSTSSTEWVPLAADKARKEVDKRPPPLQLSRRLDSSRNLATVTPQ